MNLSLYDKSWIVVKNESGQIEKIIFNEGNGITFVNRYGEVIEKIPFDSSISKTKFLDNHLGVEDSNKILDNILDAVIYDWELRMLGYKSRIENY